MSNNTGASVKATVSEENGEISCSIEETNRIRALLGLKPLNEKKENNEVIAVKNFKDKQVADRKAKESEELRNKIEIAKTKRILKEKLEFKNLSAVDEEESSLLSAADWVKRSRVIATQPKPSISSIEENKSSYDDEQQEYTSVQLKGLKVMHDYRDFEEGQEIILTLADTNILRKDDRGRILGIAEDEDVLENIHMTEEMKRQDADRRKKRARQPIYGGYDDEEFVSGALPGAKRSILSHYDKEEKSGPKYVIGREDDDDMISSHPSSSSSGTNRPTQSLARDQHHDDINQDFYTKAEFSTIKKRNTDKTKKTRRIQKVSLDADDDDEVDLDAILTKSSSSSSNNDRGSRKSSSIVDDMKTSSNKRQDNYEKALKAAELKTKLAFASSASSSHEKVDIMLEESLARLQRVNDMQKSSSSMNEEKSNDMHVSGHGHDRGAAIALNIINQQKNFKHHHNHHSIGMNEMKIPGDDNNDIINHADIIIDDEVDVDGRKKDGTLIFSSTTEFTARLQAQLNDKARSQAEKATQRLVDDKMSKNRRHMDDDHHVVMNDAVLRNHDQMMDMDVEIEDVDDNEEEDDDDDIMHNDDDQDDDDDDDEHDDQLDFLHHQPLASSSTAAALALLKSSGDLKSNQKLAGRAKDSRDMAGEEKKTGEIKIEYRDEYGRELTKKEAYRQLCYRFHGYGPGKMKKDKRIKNMEAQKKAGTSVNAGESVTMKSLERAQEATGKAHVMIQGGTGNAASNASSLSTLAAQLLVKAKKKQTAALKKKKSSS